MKDTKIVDEIIHYLKLNNAGHIDRDNVVDVLIKYINDRNQNEFNNIKKKINRIVSDLEDLI